MKEVLIQEAVNGYVVQWDESTVTIYDELEEALKCAKAFLSGESE